jgi:poly-gamma-glutamate synthesis protein (capsule biosynthesis protein)
VKLAFLGDIAIFDNGMLKVGWEKRLKDIKKVFDEHDIVIANLEVPLTDRKKTSVCKGIHLKSDNRIIPILKYLKINGVCLANNHICDFGISGMEDTIKTLKNENISFYGVNHSEWKINYDNNKIAFHGFCCYSSNGAKYINYKGQSGIIPLTRKNVIDALEKDKLEGVMSVLSFHWGDEYSQLPNERQVAFVHELADNYNFILHGHHAHVMQGIETFKNSVIAYNQGNFCFDVCASPVNPKLVIKQSDLNKESFILSVEMENNHIISWDSIGIWNESDGIKVIDNKEKVCHLSSKITHCNETAYKEESLQMIRIQKTNNLAKHNLNWLISKLNYYSIGAKIASYRNEKEYKRAY